MGSRFSPTCPRHSAKTTPAREDLLNPSTLERGPLRVERGDLRGDLRERVGGRVQADLRWRARFFFVPAIFAPTPALCPPARWHLHGLPVGRGIDGRRSVVRRREERRRRGSARLEGGNPAAHRREAGVKPVTRRVRDVHLVGLSCLYMFLLHTTWSCAPDFSFDAPPHRFFSCT